MRPHGRRLRALLLTVVLGGVALVAPVTAGAQAQTVVSLTFDDGWDNQYATVSTLNAHGMKGTYYVNTGDTGESGRLSWDQLVALDAAGQEVTGHTLDHPDLVPVDATEARRQICDDRQNLVSRGFIAKSFAYPFGSYDATTQSIAAGCGYASGRGAFGLRNITSTTDTRPFASKIPPPDPYAILTPCCIRADVTLTQLQNYIVGAENNGGGWVPLVLHRICANCGGDDPAPSITPATFQAFVDWLAQRSSRGTVVRTVAQVISGDAQPETSSAQCGSTTCASWYRGPVSVSLQTTDAGSGVAAVRYTLDGSEPTVSSQLYTGPFTVSQTTTVKFRSWDNGNNVEPTKSQLIQIDATAPDADGDGHSAASDCDDANAQRHPGALEVLNNAIDDNCDGIAAEDRDGDGFLRGSRLGEDCNDLDRNVHPGATDIAADGIAQNCVTDGPPPVLQTSLTYKWKPRSGGVLLTKFKLTSVPSEAAVRVTCRGRRDSCPFQKWAPKVEGTNKVGLRRRFRGRVLKPRTKVKVYVTAPRSIGKFSTLKVAKGYVQAKGGCIAPGSDAATPCAPG